jgi:hypothetical protein
MKSAATGLNLLGQLSKQDRYQIPVDTEQGRTVVNITLKNATPSNTEQAAPTGDVTTIEASLKTDSLGTLTFRMKLAMGADGNVVRRGELVSDSSEGNEYLQSVTGLDSDISLGTVMNTSDTDTYATSGERVSRGVSCRTAVDMVRTMMELV